MQTGRIRKLGCLLCLCLAAIVVAQSKTPSVLDRVQRVDDPQLGELIRAAMENRPNLNQSEKLDLMRQVTLSYAQIRLLDQQIEEVSRKIGLATGPSEVRYELLLARTELESKLMTEMTNLREIMGIVPKYPFDKLPVETLQTTLYLNPIGERVYVFDRRKPFIDDWARTRYEPLGLMSEEQVLNLIRERVKDPNNLPIRVDVLRTSETAEKLRARVVDAISKAGHGLQAEVHLDMGGFIGSGQTPFFLREGRAVALYPAPVAPPDGPLDKQFTSGFVDLQDLEQHILWRLTCKWNLPFTFRIEYDQASSDLAGRIADEARRIVKRLDLAELVDVKSVRVEPVPEAAFAGRWEAVTEGEIQTIVLQPERVCVLTAGKGSAVINAKATTTCPWVLTTDEIIIDPQKFTHPHRYVYRGRIDKNGHLVVHRGLIYPQGSFFVSETVPTILKKVE